MLLTLEEYISRFRSKKKLDLSYVGRFKVLVLMIIIVILVILVITIKIIIILITIISTHHHQDMHLSLCFLLCTVNTMIHLICISGKVLLLFLIMNASLMKDQTRKSCTSPNIYFVSG